MMKRFTSVLLLFLALCSPGLAQGLLTPPAAQVITEYPDAFKKAGVHKARCIFEDSHGIIWLGTDYGLYRYDGTNVDYINHQVKNPNSLPDNVVITVCEDISGDIWAGCLQGVAHITAKGLQCTTYTQANRRFADAFDNKVYADKDGSIWVGNSSGLWRLNKKAGRFERVWRDETPATPGTAYVHTVNGWKNDTLIAGTYSGIVLVNKHNFGFRRFFPPKQGFMAIHVFVDSLYRVWIGTWSQGIALTDANCRSLRFLHWEKTAPMQLADVITAIAPGSDRKTLWIATTQGLYSINNYIGGSGTIHVTPVPRPNNYAINGMLADDDGYLWLSGPVISRFYAGKRFFDPFVPVRGSIQDIQQLPDGKRLAISTWYSPSGLTVADRQTRKVVFRQADQKDDRASAISGLAVDRYKRIWLPSFNGIQVLDSNFSAAHVRPAIIVNNDVLAKPKINAVFIHNDTVWAACYKKGIQLLDLNFHVLKTFLQYDRSGLRDNLFTRFFADSRGTIWACGNSYLYKYVPLASKFIAYNLSEEDNDFTVNDITETRDHRLLVATEAGLFIFDPVSGRHSRVSSPLVKEPEVESVALANNGDIWFITREHLVYYQPKINHFKLFGQEDGLQTHADLQIIRTFDGNTFYLGETDRIETFSTNNIPKIARPPVVYVHAVQVNDSTASQVPGTGTLHLSYRQNRLYFELGMINYIKAEQNLYAYKLKGLETPWVYTTRNYAAYDNLSPGAYTFYLKGQDSNGAWSKTTSYSFVIAPPFWGTWWFRAVSIITLSLLAFFAIRFVVQRNLREKILTLEKEQAIEKERNRIARDMHDDLGSGLTKIAILSELTKAHIENRKSASVQLETISSVSRELVDSLQNIVWLLNPKNDSLESLTLYIRRYINNFFESSGIVPAFDFPAETAHVKLTEEQRRNIFLVAKEACNNILKHAGASSVMLKLCLEGGAMQLVITDNGQGFEPDEVNRLSNGIRNMRNRVEQIGGTFEVSPVVGEGTTVRIAIGEVNML